MPDRSGQPVEYRIDAAAFDFSDEDGGEPLLFDRSHAGASHARVDLSDDVLAMCALMVFKDRRRSRGGRALPGL